MTQIVVTLSNDADSTFIQRVIENMKGVLKTSMRTNEARQKKDKANEWIERMQELSNSIDSSVIDWNDEKTQYLMSK